MSRLIRAADVQVRPSGHSARLTQALQQFLLIAGVRHIKSSGNIVEVSLLQFFRHCDWVKHPVPPVSHTENNPVFRAVQTALLWINSRLDRG